MAIVRSREILTESQKEGNEALLRNEVQSTRMGGLAFSQLAGTQRPAPDPTGVRGSSRTVECGQPCQTGLCLGVCVGRCGIRRREVRRGIKRWQIWETLALKEWLANKGQENMIGEPEEALQNDGEKMDGGPQMWLTETLW